jgi:aldose 1-epimerase
LAADDPEFQLSAGDWRATVAPLGASLRRLWLQTASGPARDIVWGYSGAANKKGGQGDVLVPWPGRLRGGAYTFEGKAHQLPRNDKDGPNAIHGFLRTRVWEGEMSGTNSARFRTHIQPTDHEGYPFDIEVVLGYELLPTGLACAIVVRNDGKSAAPFGAGFHPYFVADLAKDELRVPASQVVEFADLLPTGKVLDVPPELDFRTPRPVGATRINIASPA